jgi:sugar lactone lactonase YvrE
LPPSSKICLAFSLLAAALLSGCGPFQEQQLTPVSTTNSPSSPTTPATVPGSAIVGNVHGGQQAVTGAHIYLFAANPAGYGSPSISMLNSSQPGVETDVLGNYVLTDAIGNFSISGDYTCTSGQQVYLLALGGNPGLPPGETNPALALMSAFGACPEGQTNFASTVPYVFINEVTTVAAAYALSGFMTDATHLGYANTPGAQQGIANAFLTVPNLVDLSSGAARIQNVAGNGDVPQSKINSLANLLVTCVNSDGGAGCAPLFSNAPGHSGAAPADTIVAALNISHNPGANASALFNASLTSPVFGPALAAAPNDWTLALTFNAGKMVAPYFPAIDSIGNVWVPGYIGNNLTEFDPTGKILSDANGFTGGGLNLPYSIAIDASDNPWVVNFGPLNASTISKFSTTGASLTSSAFPCATACFFPAFDAAQNLWVSGTDRTTILRGDGSVLKTFPTATYDSGIAVNSAGIGWTIGQPRTLFRFTLPATQSSTAETSTAAAGNDLTSLAVDSSDNIWYASSLNNAIGVSDKNGAPVSPAAGYTGGGLKGPAQIAIDGSNRVWVANRDGSSLSAFTNTGVAISPAAGYQADGLSNPRGLAIDASGNIWLTNFTANSITEFIGIATPSATPISATTHGQRP